MTQIKEWTEKTEIGFVDMDVMSDLLTVRQTLKNQHYRIIVYKKSKEDEKSVVEVAKIVSNETKRLKEIVLALSLASQQLVFTFALSEDGVHFLTINNLSYATTTAISQEFLEDCDGMVNIIRKNIEEINAKMKIDSK